MHSYRYKGNKKQALVMLIVAPIATIGGIWLLFNDYVLAFGYGDNGPALGPTVSKVMWVLVALFGIGLVIVGLRALRVDDQRVQISQDAIIVPKGEFSNETITLRRGEITSLKTFANQGTRSLMIKYNGGKTKLVNSRFDSNDDFDAAVAGVVAVANVPLTVSKL